MNYRARSAITSVEAAAFEHAAKFRRQPGIEGDQAFLALIALSWSLSLGRGRTFLLLNCGHFLRNAGK
jgi:hypothetical protein